MPGSTKIAVLGQLASGTMYNVALVQQGEFAASELIRDADSTSSLVRVWAKFDLCQHGCRIHHDIRVPRRKISKVASVEMA